MSWWFAKKRSRYQNNTQRCIPWVLVLPFFMKGCIIDGAFFCDPIYHTMYHYPGIQLRMASASNIWHAAKLSGIFLNLGTPGLGAQEVQCAPSGARISGVLLGQPPPPPKKWPFYGFPDLLACAPRRDLKRSLIAVCVVGTDVGLWNGLALPVCRRHLEKPVVRGVLCEGWKHRSKYLVW